MGRRIAHRPRYTTTRYLQQPRHYSHKDYLHLRWAYRHLAAPKQKRRLGQGLLRLPLSYKLAQSMGIRA